MSAAFKMFDLHALRSLTDQFGLSLEPAHVLPHQPM